MNIPKASDVFFSSRFFSQFEIDFSFAKTSEKIIIFCRFSSDIFHHVFYIRGILKLKFY